MSGIEVVGLVLGAFPLAISALEDYREVSKALGLLANFQAEWRSTLNDIKDEQILFRLTLHALVMPMVNNGELDDGDLETLLADSSHERWASADMTEALQQRLGQTHVRFMEIAADLQHVTTKLLNVLGVDKPKMRARMNIQENLEPGSDVSPREKLGAGAIKASIAYRREQLKFGLGKPRRDELMGEIRQKREKLDLLLEKSDKVASYQQPKTVAISPKSVKSLLQYWRHADRIHRLIRQSWGCTCRAKHCAHLWLQHQTSPTFEFKLLVLWSPILAQCGALWQPQGLCITYSEGAPLQHPGKKGLVLPKALPAASAITSDPKTALVNGAKKQRLLPPGGVRFDLTPSSSGGVNCISSKSSPAVEAKVACASTSNPNLLQEISKLCVALGSCGMQPICFGSLTDEEQGSQYRVFSQPEQKMSATEITLDEVLADTTSRELTRSDRFRIALAIASSHLQLHSTPWARNQWEAHDIRFPKSTQSPSSVMFDRPYVSTDFNIMPPAEQRGAKKSDRSFACLGIMLLELLFGARLEDHPLWSKLDLSSVTRSGSRSMFRLMIAREWAESVEGEAGEEFSAAIKWCLNDSPTTLYGDEWREDLAKKVVLPLQQCCNWIKSRPPP